MTTATQASAIKKSLSDKNIKSEIKLLRSFIISIIGEDKEGAYSPEFIKEALKSSKEKSTHLFRDKHSFLKKLRQNG